MKYIYTGLRRFFNDPRCLVLWVVLALAVPNVVLAFTENSPIAWKIANVALPTGVYILLMVAGRRTGLMALLSLPLMFFAAFQLVLSYLYGESIIAVDMFLNVVTTNVAEATELLANLFIAILTVVVLYLPPLIWGAAACKRFAVTSGFRREAALWGAALVLFGTGMAGVAAIGADNRSFHREIFPVNVIGNLVEAVHRASETSHYPETSAGFTYGASSGRPAGEREIYVYVIGETSRSCNWQLGGYERHTNPRLSQTENVVFCRRAISESNTTHKSVPMLMSFATAENFDSIAHYKSIITAMKEAGFHTWFFSNQAPNRSFTEFFGNEADVVRYADFSQPQHPYDAGLLPMVEEAIADTLHAKQFIVLHSYGSHFLYRDRYPREFAHFLPDGAIDANAGNRKELINAYDNSILCTDAFLADVIHLLNQAGCRSAMLYSADHGEDIFDDNRERFLHASPNPTYWQLHVAMLLWLSQPLIDSNPDIMATLQRNALSCVSPQKSMFNTALELAGVSSPKLQASQSLVNRNYIYSDPVYLTDLNVAVPLMQSGVKPIDMDMLNKILE